MIKIKEKLASWDEGRAFINRMADELGAKIEDINEDLRINHNDIMVNCHFDDRDFSYIVIKFSDKSKETMIRSILNQFQKKDN